MEPRNTCATTRKENARHTCCSPNQLAVTTSDEAVTFFRSVMLVWRHERVLARVVIQIGQRTTAVVVLIRYHAALVGVAAIRADPTDLEQIVLNLGQVAQERREIWIATAGASLSVALRVLTESCELQEVAHKRAEQTLQGDRHWRI